MYLSNKIQFISIHVPAWGTTIDTGNFKLCNKNFNPRSRVGNDIIIDTVVEDYDKISIHVPAWGTTINVSISKGYAHISIHVPAWGTTSIAACVMASMPYFNPRSRVGNDCTPGAACKLLLHFNPRSRVGNDVAPGTSVLLMDSISIHVPAWGTTA